MQGSSECNGSPLGRRLPDRMHNMYIVQCSTKMVWYTLYSTKIVELLSTTPPGCLIEPWPSLARLWGLRSPQLGSLSQPPFAPKQQSVCEVVSHNFSARVCKDLAHLDLVPLLGSSSSNSPWFCSTPLVPSSSSPWTSSTPRWPTQPTLI